MTRAELIRMFVLNECCDDYEDIEQIAKGAVELGSKCGLTISREDMIQALRELIEMRYMKAWDLRRWRTRRPREIKERRKKRSPR